MPAVKIAPALSGGNLVPLAADLPTAPHTSKNMQGKNSKNTAASSGRKGVPTVADIVVDPITQTASDYWAPGAEVSSPQSRTEIRRNLPNRNIFLNQYL